MLIDWDKIFNWKVWQVFKWVTGIVIIGLIVYGIMNVDKCIEWQKYIIDFFDKYI